MKLYYTGSVRRLSGSGMAFLNFENEIDKVCERVMIECPETTVYIYGVYEEGIDFGISYFDNETRYFVHKDEVINHKKEGNAFGYEIAFSIVE